MDLKPLKDYLNIDYNGRLPMIVCSNSGWETYKPIYAEELYDKIIVVDLDESGELIEELNNVNREVVDILLNRISQSKNIGFIRFLKLWKEVEVKKVHTKINAALSKLKSVGKD